MKKAMLRRPKENFNDRLSRKLNAEYWRDMAWITYLAHKASADDSPLTEKRKKRVIASLNKKLNQRINDRTRSLIPAQWDERNYRPLRILEKELKL